MSGQLNWDLLDRYLSGGCTPEQADEISRWAADDPAHARELDAARRVWAAAAEGADRFDTNGQWSALHERIVRAGGAIPRRRTARWHRAAAIAAGVMLAVGAAAWGWRAGVLRPAAHAVAFREYSTRNGQRAEILLPDGTRAMLNVASRLRVPATYGAGARDVQLDGEAFFDVRHDARAPFRVHTAGAVAQDLGTAFVVRAYPDDHAVTVVVRTGKVALGADSAAAARAALLGAGQLGRLDTTGQVTVQQHVDVDAHLAWMRGALVFRLRPFADVVRELDRWYDVDITLDDASLATTPVTLSFTNQSLDEVLAIITQSLDVRAQRDGSHVRLYTVPRR